MNIKDLKLENIKDIKLDSDTDAVTITFAFPVKGSSLFAEHAEVLTIDEGTPEYLRVAVKEFATASLRAVREGVAEGGVRCSTCTGSCCRNWPLHLTDYDIRVCFNEDEMEAVERFKETTWTGHAGRMRLVPWTNPVTGAEEQACYFLDKKGACSIYERRPQVCRDFSAPHCGNRYEHDPRKHHLPVVP